MPKLIAYGNAQNLRRCNGVDVVVVIERLDKLLVAAHMRKQAQFYLRIVRAYKHAILPGNKRTLDILSLVAPCRNVLKVGIR